MNLRVNNLNKSYRDGGSELKVLQNLSMDLPTGDSLAIMGPSGCGKSTLISCLAGLVQPDNGEIILGDQDLVALDPDARTILRARNIGVIFQQFHLIPHLTALENVRLPLDLNRVRDPEATRRSRAALDELGLAARESHFPNQLSRGECQRVAIARVLVMNPALILADEPTASLDGRTAKTVTEKLVELSQHKKVSLIVVTHDHEIAKLCQTQRRFVDGQLEARA